MKAKFRLKALQVVRQRTVTAWRNSDQGLKRLGQKLAQLSEGASVVVSGKFERLNWCGFLEDLGLHQRFSSSELPLRSALTSSPCSSSPELR